MRSSNQPKLVDKQVKPVESNNKKDLGFKLNVQLSQFDIDRSGILVTSPAPKSPSGVTLGAIPEGSCEELVLTSAVLEEVSKSSSDEGVEGKSLDVLTSEVQKEAPVEEELKTSPEVTPEATGYRVDKDKIGVGIRERIRSYYQWIEAGRDGRK
ncbi:MAG: hypothetical protein V4489_09090 [Chlamydiota bacterium]